jgi:hypothetical protein
MSKIRIYAVMIALTLIFGLVATNFVSAGETVKIKATATSINTKWHEIEVGDAEGHVIGLFQNTQVWVVNESTGEKSTQLSRGTMDFNRKTGQGTVQGYSIMTYASGDKRWGSYDGKIVGKGKWEGTWTDINGTGKYEGCKGGGTWTSQSMARGISHLTAEGERTFK